MSSSAENFIRYAISIGAIELVPEGRKLKSGRISPYFFNTGLFNTGESLTELALAYASAIKHIRFEAVFGPAYKGIPLAAVIAAMLYRESNIDVGYAYNRKEEKDHGEGGITAAYPMKNKMVCIVDDVMTTSVTAQESVGIVKAAGGRAVCYAIAFDREEQGISADGKSAVSQIEQEYNIPVLAAARLTDLIAVLNHNEYLNSKLALPKILEYQKRYGAKS